MSTKIINKMSNAAKWSAITEVLGKLITPISSMFLARLLSPEAYGVVATVTMITSFAEIFADAGFQKYMVQHEFETEEEKNESANVAFWTNVIVSMSIWLFIALFRHPLAQMIGSEGLGNTLAIAGASIPLVSVSSLQTSLFRRSFDYRTLFQIRMCTLLVPFIITIPLAFFTHSYWALIIGTLTVNLINTVLLTYKSEWKPKFQFNMQHFKKMFSFSMWTLLEQISIWFSSNIDIFIVGSVLSSYYLGMYKTAMTTSTMILGIITGATTSLLFSALSRLQNDYEEFKELFFKFQRIVSLLVMPMGVGIFIYRDLVTLVLLGEQWLDIADFLGVYSLLGAFSTVLSHYCSEIYRALGKPKLSFVVQIIYILGLIPVVYFSVQQPFETLTINRSLMRMYMVLVHSVFMWKVIGLSMLQLLKNIMPSIVCACIMGLFGVWINSFIDAMWWNIVCVGLCIVFYFVIVCVLFPKLREEAFQFFKRKNNNYQ